MQPTTSSVSPPNAIAFKLYFGGVFAVVILPLFHPYFSEFIDVTLSQ
jgi:hypothetical protein